MPEVFSRDKQQPENSRAKSKRYTPPSIKHDRPSSNPLSAFLIKPERAAVAILEEDEEVFLIIRQHPVTLIPRLLVVLLIMGIGGFFTSLIDISFLPIRFSIGFGLLWALFLTGMLLEKIISWYFNVIVITDERIIDIDFLHLVYKNITVTKIENIEDVTYSVTGVIQSLLNYGNVLIQTAGEVISMSPQQTTASIEIWGTPNPAKVVVVLNDLMLQEEQEKLEGRAK